MESLKKDEVYIAGYLHFYVKNGELKKKIIPVELQEAFMEKFGNDLLNADEDEVDKFLNNQ
jgi:hypothetical protein